MSRDDVTEPRRWLLATATSRVYAPGALVALASALRRFRHLDRLAVCVLEDGVSPGQRRAFERLGARYEVPLHLMDVRERFSGDLPETGYLTRAAYARLLAPQLFPHASRVVYLDADTLVVGDISELFSAELSGATVGAAPDTGIRMVRESMPWLAEDEFGAPSRTYLNSGVLVMDGDSWREDRVAERIVEFTSRYADRINFGDQDSINAVIGAGAVVLPASWNYQVGAEAEMRRRGERREPERQPEVLHYVGVKPWLSAAAVREIGERGHHLRWWREYLRLGPRIAGTLPLLFGAALRRAVLDR